MGNATFTLDDLLAAMRGGPSQQADLSEFATAQQWADRLGVSLARMREIIRGATGAGLVEFRRVQMADLGLICIDHANRPTNAYAFRIGAKAGPGPRIAPVAPKSGTA